MDVNKVYLVGPSYKWDDDIEVFLSPESALEYYQKEEDDFERKSDGTYFSERRIFHLSEDKTTILDDRGEDRYYIESREIK